MEDVRLPAGAAFPEVRGLKGPLSCLNEARFGILFGVVGAARACYEAALEYSIERTQFGGPIARFQLTQRKLVEMMVGVNRAMLLALHIGRMKDAGTAAPEHISFGKYDNVGMALRVAREARSVLGANGVTLEYPVIRHMNNLESVYTYEGTNEIHTLIMGQAITGISAFE
jgi:glutaryl-CoA dehydrogenase